MKIGIYGQFYHPNAAEYIGQLLEILDQKNIEVHIEEDFLGLIQENKTITKDYPRFKAFEELDNSFELFFLHWRGWNYPEIDQLHQEPGHSHRWN